MVSQLCLKTRPRYDLVVDEDPLNYVSFYLLIYALFIYSSIHPLTYKSIYLLTYLILCLYIYLSFFLQNVPTDFSLTHPLSLSIDLNHSPICLIHLCPHPRHTRQWLSQTKESRPSQVRHAEHTHTHTYKLSRV